jgi:hypothetical protein
MYNHAIMLRLICPLLLLLPALTFAEDRSTWQNLIQLQAGDTVRLSLKSRGAVTGTYHEWTPEQVTVGSTTAKREDVTKLERYRKGAWGRGKTAGMGALIGGGAGAGIGAASAGCKSGSFGPCITRFGGAAIVGAAGAIVGALVGALIPPHKMDVIYSVR